MVKNLLKYIFIYTLLVGCSTDNLLINDECTVDCVLDVEASDLELDENGYYHIEWLEGYNQTFSTLSASTGIDGSYYQKVWWYSHGGIEYSGEFVMSVNRASYTNEDGIANTVLSTWEEQIGDTITVYALYRDYCEGQHMDSIKVVIDNEI
tara:strand:- start:46 stop:498 length:453 start_codon:yes stop_codon:yes gene_type:complete